MPVAETVSVVVAARLAEKYPRLADIAAEAVLGALVVSKGARHRKYLMPGGQVVVLDEPLPTEADVLRARLAVVEAENAALKAPKADAKPEKTETKAEAKKDTKGEK